MSRSNRMLTLAASTALASALLGGCATQAAPRADLSANRAEVALKKGKVSDAIAHAESAVLADPRNAAYRTMLGAAYMEAGRFLSARTSFDDAMTLGDETPRTALGYALAAVATGDNGAAIEVLDDWREDIPAADVGLAYALAGQPSQGVQILSNAIRAGDASPKTRQNLAYALALNGDWSGARIMAAQDVSADQVDARIVQWAAMARPEEAPIRVAALLGTRIATDGGQPAQLALANHPTHEQLAIEASAYAAPAGETAPVGDVALAGGELPALDANASASASAPALAVAAPQGEAPRSFEAAFAAPVPTAATPGQMLEAAVGFVAQPVVQQAPTRFAAAEQTPRKEKSRTAEAGIAAGEHLVQLGSFSSEAGARRAWTVYAKRFPQLSQFDMVISKAIVRGKTYYRVSAGGLARADAGSFCSSAKRKGQGCIAWSQSRPLPGAVASPVRMARR